MCTNSQIIMCILSEEGRASENERCIATAALALQLDYLEGHRILLNRQKSKALNIVEENAAFMHIYHT